MKILRVISSMDPMSGGPCQGIRNIVPHLLQLGVENEVVCLDNPTNDYGILDTFRIYKLGQGKTSYHYQPELVTWLIANCNNYDFIIVHGLWQYPNYAVYKAIKRLKKMNRRAPKVIIMPHGMLDPYFQKAPERKLKALRNRLVWQLIEKKCIKAADGLFFTCEEELLLARTTFKSYHPKKEFNVGYGVQKPPIATDIQKKSFSQLVPALKNNYWLFLSRIHSKKGVDLLIEAYNQLCLQNIELPDLVIAGPTESDYAVQMIAKAKFNTKIHFTGMLKGDAKWGAFYGCDLYVLPSYQENFGISLVEAMACEKPVLITKNINIWREIEEGKTGWILEKLNVQSIVTQLLQSAKMETSQLKQMGQQAQRCYEHKFSIPTRAAIFVKTLKQL